MIIAVANRKASPGTTTVTALLATYWREPEKTRIIIEADPSGGTLAARWSDVHGVSWNPGLVDLATTRAEHDAGSLSAISQELAPGVLLLAAPPAPDQVINALATMGDKGAAALAGAAGARCFVDCGRLDGRSAALVLAKRAAVTLLVCRPVLEELHSVLAGVVELRAVGCNVGLVLVGEGPWPAEEIAATADVEVFGQLPWDERAARRFTCDGLTAGRAFQRSPLSRSVAELTSELQLVCASARVPVPRSPDGPSPADAPLAGGPARRARPLSLSPALARARQEERPTTNGGGA